ncbi:MAG: VOC family protein [Rhodobacteraceae bacterium]|nr:VOC family protein [Paracoccaceae bacterium]
MALGYVMIGTDDVPRARALYDAIMPAIGGRVYGEYLPHAVCYEMHGGSMLWLTNPYNGEAASVGNGAMVGLMCASEEGVQTAHALGLNAGGTNEGDPGPRPQYGPDFYGAYLRDLDGNKLSFVHISPPETG